MNTLITLTGPTCAGKTTLEELLIGAGAARVVSNTTRAPRPGEVDGVHYRFRDPAWFYEREVRGELIESVRFDGTTYGNTEDDVIDAFHRGHGFAVWVIEPHGHKQVKAWAEKRAAVRHYSVFVDGKTEEIANRFLARVTNGQMSHAKAAARLTEMFTSERGWVAEAHTDVFAGGNELYDCYVERFDPTTEASVVNYLLAIARDQAPIQPATDGLYFRKAA